jgi:hypothetical protein
LDGRCGGRSIGNDERASPIAKTHIGENASLSGICDGQFDGADWTEMDIDDLKAAIESRSAAAKSQAA